jgi:hypothetical protein
MKDASYLLKLARRCRRLEKTAIESEVIEQLGTGPPSWSNWPKILSPELFSPKWLNDLFPTDQGSRLQERQLVLWSDPNLSRGRKVCRLAAGGSRISNSRSPAMRTRFLGKCSLLGADESGLELWPIFRGTESSNPLPSSGESPTNPSESWLTAPG